MCWLTCARVLTCGAAASLRSSPRTRPTLRAVNPRTWIKGTNYRELQFRESFRAFRSQRADLLAVLEHLPPKGWSRAATVTGAGSVLVRSVHFYAQWLARHERTHVKQIERIVNATK